MSIKNILNLVEVILICQVCYERDATEYHHLFSQTKLNKKLYGDLIHDSRNLLLVCSICHHSKSIPKYTEVQFCKALNIVPKGKFAKLVWDRLTN